MAYPDPPLTQAPAGREGCDGPVPLLSVITIIAGDTISRRGEAFHLACCLEALHQQAGPPPMEIIVPYAGAVDGIDDLKVRFADVRFIAVDDMKAPIELGASHEHHHELRARGIAQARGEIVGLLEGHERPASDWCARMVEAHVERYPRYAGVGGAIENAIDRPLNWATYFCDFGKYQNPVCEGESPWASDVNVAYKRSALDAIERVWRESFNEVLVHGAFASRGDRVALTRDVVVYQHRERLGLVSGLRERFIWGRSFAGARCRLVGGGKRLMYAALAPALPGVLLFRMARNALQKGRTVPAFLKAFPITILLTLFWSLGEWVGYLAGPSDAQLRAEIG